jgi:hypothetical protein
VSTTNKRHGGGGARKECPGKLCAANYLECTVHLRDLILSDA